MAANRNVPKSKRGIVLLLVISLLALFVLIGVTYALVAARYLDAAKTQTLNQQTGDLPEKEIDIVLAQILYDTAARSSLRGHSFLGDLYGQDYIYNTAADGNSNNDTRVVTVAGGMWGNQAFGFHVSGQALQPPQGNGPLSPNLDYYTGRLLTFTEGPADGYSGRILQYDPTHASGPQFVIELDYSSHRTFGAPLAENHFVINGAPFNGAGAGYSVSGGNLNATYAGSDGAGGLLGGNPVALLPHFNAYDPVSLSAGGLSDLFDAGGLDEAWDAVDFQNMFLAMVPPRAAELFTSGSGNYQPIIPSYHRPELLNYWRWQLDSTNGQPDVTQQAVRDQMRTVVFRPMPWDHPNFTGSNPNFAGQFSSGALQNGPTLLNNLAHGDGTGGMPLWDVDNDGDGYKDSIWIDPGLPLITTPDGKRVKRLVCVLIKDLDGRIDLNAHGNLAQTNIMAAGAPNTYLADTILSGNFGLATAGNYLPRGMGFGPAEVDFRHVLSNDDNLYSALLLGRYASNLANDQGMNARPGIPSTRDEFSFVKHHGVPDNYVSIGYWYASPPDVWGRGAIALDYGGQPLTYGMGSNNEMRDSPYELSLSGEFTGRDSPYLAVEIERLLRFHDADAALLPSRPAQFAPNYLALNNPGVIDNSHRRREMLAGMTSSMPVPGTVMPAQQRTSYPPSEGRTILDLYRHRLQAGGATNINQEMTYIVPWEIRQGGKFNLNRWLGDGFDTNGDGTPDDPLESFVGENGWQGPAGFTGVAATHSNGITFNALSRQLYARHLFCLAMLFVDNNFGTNPPPHESTLSAGQSRQLFVRRLAQWAINCVDFRDADSIMTPFEFDYNPWNGWNVDGVLQSGDEGSGEYGLVWGTEFPDLLITETLAFHDRRVKDTEHDDDPTKGKKRTEPMAAMRDQTLDQFRMPQGSLFVELHCPRNTYNRNPGLPRELYDYTSVPSNPPLALGKVTANGWPVWRMAITPVRNSLTNPDATHPNNMVNTRPESASYDTYPHGITLPFQGATFGSPIYQAKELRYVWFTSRANASGVAGSALDNYSFYSNSHANPLMQSGQYAVIGPRTNTYLGSQDPSGADPGTALSLWGGNSKQSIVLNPGNPGSGSITINDAAGNISTYTPPANIKFPLVMLADIREVTPNGWVDPLPPDMPIGLNVSEPLPVGDLAAMVPYYKEPILAPMAAGAPKDAYSELDGSQKGFPDLPIETDTGGANWPLRQRGNMIETATYTECSAIYLQRLANPNLPFNPLPTAAPNPEDPPYDSSIPVNPYLTVDWATIDLSVFTGEEDTTQTVAVDGGKSIDPDDPATRTFATRFRTRQRGQLTGSPPVAPNANPWPPSTNNLNATNPGAFLGSPYFRHSLDTSADSTVHTFPYLNWSISPQASTPPAPTAGEPANPFPWLTWNNRPFSNPMELLLVPSSAPSRICSEITPGFELVSQGATNPYDNSSGWNYRFPFGQLLNFFHSSANPDDSSTLCRLLDYVEVPSPYVGTEKWFNPSQFYTSPAQHLYQPPFNKMSRFRDPGRININTIFDENIWIAATGQFPGMNTIDFANAIFLSRQAYGAVPASGNPFDYAMSGNYPTRFANPFRPADTSDLMPNVGSMQRTNPVEATLLRPLPDPTNGTQFAGGANRVPLLNRNLTNAWDNTDRNPYFRYQAMQKLGNVFTTHSNCYAVWITMGYFEAEVAGVTAATPDGYALGQEIGFDTGEVTRHRAFFIIDRSVPVGFIPGQKLNTMDCVLLRRFIE